VALAAAKGRKERKKNPLWQFSANKFDAAAGLIIGILTESP